LPNRIAANDAVRSWLWKQGHGPIFPIEVKIEAEESGRPRVRSEHAPDLRISIAGKPGVSAAIVAQGREVGIDVERIEPRDRSFEDLAFTPTERAMLPGEERDEWVARFWAAKEAAAKARGTGLEGNPKSVTISERDGTRLRADGRWISTAREGDLVFAWWIEEP
jgi:phosphopantetheinyl transferase